MMEMSPEIAVLISAVQLSSKYNVTKEEHSYAENFKKSLEILQHAVGEITEGLETDNSANQKSLWQYKLHGIFFASVLRSSCRPEHESGVTETLGDLESLVAVFPPINSELYFELVKLCGWAGYLAECLSYLRFNENLGLQFSQDILSYCLERQENLDANDLDLILAVTEHLITINFIMREPGNEVTERDRRASGLYEYMGRTPSTESAPPGEQYQNYQKLYQNLLSCVRKLFNSIPAPALPDDVESEGDMQSYPFVKLIAGITFLGGTQLLVNAKLTLGETDVGLKERCDNWTAIFASTRVSDWSSVTRKGCEDLQKCIAKLQSPATSDIQEIREVTRQKSAQHSPYSMLISYQASHTFPVQEWCDLLKELFQKHAWVEYINDMSRP